jgi:hypothetical protein
VRDAAVLGAVTGVTVLGCPAAILFVPALAVAAMVHDALPPVRRLRHAALISAVGVAVIAPWTLRNALTFGRFVPVRTGAGQIAWIGTVALSETIAPGLSGTSVPVPWRAQGATDAVMRSLASDARAALHEFQLRVPEADPPAGYAAMNEAERDGYYMGESLRFVREHPVLTLQLAIAKLKLLVAMHGFLGLWIALGAVLSGLVGLLRSDLRALALLAGAYVAPFALIVPYFPRYRLSIEPVLAVLAVAGIAWLASLLRRTGPLQRMAP